MKEKPDREQEKPWKWGQEERREKARKKKRQREKRREQEWEEWEKWEDLREKTRRRTYDEK